jgi:hypothetical protein
MWYQKMREVVRMDALEKRSNRILIRNIIICVAILILLAGIILPALQRPKEIVHHVKCTSNLKQIVFAMKQYSLDNNDFYPFVGDDMEPYQAFGLLHPNYASALEVFRFPSGIDERWDATAAHENDNKDNAPFTKEACAKSLSYAYSFNKDGYEKRIRGPWKGTDSSTVRIVADKYVTHDYSTDPYSKSQPAIHQVERHWGKYRGGRHVAFLDGSAKWEEIITPLDVDENTEYENSGHPEHDQTGVDWWSDLPDKP